MVPQNPFVIFTKSQVLPAAWSFLRDYFMSNYMRAIYTKLLVCI